MELRQTTVDAETGEEVWWTFRRFGLPEFMLPADAKVAASASWAAPMRKEWMDNPDRRWVLAIRPHKAVWSKEPSGLVIEEPGALNENVNRTAITPIGLNALAGKFVAVVHETNPMKFEVLGTGNLWLAIFDDPDSLLHSLSTMELPAGVNIGATPIADGETFVDMLTANGWRLMYNPTVTRDGKREFIELIPQAVPIGHKETPKA